MTELKSVCLICRNLFLIEWKCSEWISWLLWSSHTRKLGLNYALDDVHLNLNINTKSYDNGDFKEVNVKECQIETFKSQYEIFIWGEINSIIPFEAIIYFLLFELNFFLESLVLEEALFKAHLRSYRKIFWNLLCLF